jgi:mannose-6-phosphate isomerase-like protein (cupin superfamily)
MQNALRVLAQAIANHLASATPPPGPVADAVGRFQAAAASATPNPDFAGTPNRDHTAILAPALADGASSPTAGITTAMSALPAPLPWHYHYADRDDAPDRAARIAFAELIGPRGPLAAPDCRIGFTLMAAGTFYPLHAHPAEELYLVLSGAALWMAPPAQRVAPPGGLILHPSNQPHAMRTDQQPLLALYGWSGDINSPAIYL